MTFNTPFANVDDSLITFNAIVGSVVWDMVNKVPNVTFASALQSWTYETPLCAGGVVGDE
jgi:hypothetical protein